MAKRRGYTHVVELPVEIRERFSSTISPRAVFDMLVDTVRLTWRLRIVHSYDRAAERRHEAAAQVPPPGASVWP